MILRKRHSAGFTLVEMIMVIVITGIIAGVVAVFIARPVQGYTDSARRAALTDAADTTLRQIAREIRLALPNSLRVRDSAGNVDNCAPGTICYIELIPTSDGGRYRDTGDGSTGGNFLDFANSATTAFDVLGPAVDAAANDYIVIYNLGPGYEPANAYRQASCATSPGCNIAQIDSLSGTSTIILNANVFASQSPPLPSPNARFQVVPNATRAVTYACPTAAAGIMTRHWGYGFNTAQPTPPAGGSSALVLNNVTCTVDYQPNVLQRNALLYLSLRVTADDEAVEVFDQIHVDNTP